MFREVASQKVENESGHIVQVVDRFSVEYLEPGLRVVVPVDFGLRVNVYQDSLKAYDRLLNQVALTDAKRKQVVDEIVSGIEAMGGNPVLA